MFIGQTALKICDIRLFYRSIGRKLYRRPLHKCSRSHDDLFPVPRHIPGLQSNKTVDGRRLLNRLDKPDELFFRFKTDGSRDIIRRYIHGRRSHKAEFLQAGAYQQPAFEGLYDDVRRKEQPLIKILIPVRIGADLRPDGRRRHAAGDFIDIFALPDDISARRRDASARIFNKRTDAYIDAVLRRFRFLDELTVTVIGKNASPESAFADKSTGSRDLLLT